MSNLSKIPAGVIDSVKKKCAEVVDATDVVTHVWGYNVVPDHSNRRCIDFMVKSTADGDKVAAYLKKHAKRLGVAGLIWNHRVMGFPSNGPAYRGPEGGWRNYTGPSPHTDHVHCEFNGAAYSPGSAAGKPDVKPAPAPAPAKWDGKSFPGAAAFRLGKSHAAVTLLGKRLVAHGFGKRYRVGPGSAFTDVDRLATQDFQLAQGYVGTQKGGGADGYPGPQTWAALMKDPAKKAPKPKPKPKVPVFPSGIGLNRSKPSAVTLQKQLQKAGFMPKSVKTAANYGPQTQAAVAAFHNKHTQFRSTGKTYDPAIGPKGWTYLFTNY